MTERFLVTIGSPLIRYPVVVYSDKSDLMLQFSSEHSGWNALSLSCLR